MTETVQQRLYDYFIQINYFISHQNIQQTTTISYHINYTVFFIGCRTQSWKWTTLKPFQSKLFLISIFGFWEKGFNAIFIKICLICMIVTNRLKTNIQRKHLEYTLINPCHVKLNLCWLQIEQKYSNKEISIFNNGSHFG